MRRLVDLLYSEAKIYISGINKGDVVEGSNRKFSRCNPARRGGWFSEVMNSSSVPDEGFIANG